MIKIKIMFDTEFSGLHKNTTLISIGLVSEDGQSFYAEFNDYDKSQCDQWIKDNILANLSKDTDELSTMADINVEGDKEEIKTELLKWISQFDTVEWVSDVCHYDFVLLIDLLYGEGIKVPYKTVGASCHDINQDIALHYCKSELDAFDLSREDIISDFGIEIEGKKHNSLYDAYVIKAIYENILG